MKLLLEQITITDTTGWTGPFSAGDIVRIDATKYDKGVYTKDGKTTYWYKEKGSGGGGGGVKPPVSQEPSTGFKNADEGNAFRKWFRKKYPTKATEFSLDETGGFDNAYIRKAFNYKPDGSNKTAGEIYKEETGGVLPPKVDEPKVKTIDDFDASIVSAATQTKFYDTSDRLIQWLSPEYNKNFKKDENVYKIVEDADNIKKQTNNPAIICYLKAATRFLGNKVKYFITNDKNYSKDVNDFINNKGFLVESITIKRPIGLINLLYEQTKYIIGTDFKNRKQITGSLKYNDRKNETLESYITNYNINGITDIPSFKLVSDGGLPDYSPVIGSVKAALIKTGDLKGLQPGEEPNVFTQDLENAILSYRKKFPDYVENQKYIDFLLLKNLFSDRFSKTKTEPSTKVGTSNDLDPNELLQSLSSGKKVNV